jgi:hypothetical protein
VKTDRGNPADSCRVGARLATSDSSPSQDYTESAEASPAERKGVSSEPTRPTVEPTESAACGALGCPETAPLFRVEHGGKQRVVCDRHAEDLVQRWSP